MSDNENKAHRRRFQKDIERGRRFEADEKDGWRKLDDGEAQFEAATEYGGKKGRIDILVEELGDFVSVIEVKASDWNRMAPHRVRPNALRHARQIWRYINREVDAGKDVCPGVVYREAPNDANIKGQVEGILNERGIQVVWRDDA